MQRLLVAVLVCCAPLTARGATGMGIVITEIMYNPPGDDLELEFIEIHNAGPVIFDVSGFKLQGAVTFTIPDDTFIPGHGYLVIAAKASRIMDDYGIANVVGDYEGDLDNAGETILLCEGGGGPICVVDYNDRGAWPSAADGTGHSLILESPRADVDRAKNWTWSPQLGGSPGQSNLQEGSVTDTFIVRDDATWRYAKGTVAPSTPETLWRQNSFDDRSWLTGQTGIGYGDGDDRTELTDMQNGYVSFFARLVFSVANPAALDEVFLRINYDDGFIAYLNGTEIARACAGNPGQELPYTQVATCSREAGAFEYYPIPKAALRAGSNLLACHVLNLSSTSTDVSFIPSIINRKVTLPEEVDRIPVLFNEIRAGGGSASFIELFNAGNEAVALEGFTVTFDTPLAAPYVFPAGASIAPHGMLVLSSGDLPFALEPGEIRLFLRRPNGVVVDARIYDATAYGGSHARYPDGGETWVWSIDPTPGEPNELVVEQGLVINEIMYHPISGNDHDEYLELYNRSDRAIDLSGVRFTHGVTYTFPEGVILMPHAYLVVAADRDRLIGSYGLSDALVVGSYVGTLADGGELIRILDPFGNVMDEVRYFDGGRWPEYADGLGSSLELVDPSQDNSEPAAWEASDESTKSAWTNVSYTGSLGQSPRESELHILLLEAGECLIDDLRLEISGQTTNHIPNGDFESTDLSAWRIWGTHAYSGRTTADRHGGTASMHIVATGAGDNRANALEVTTSPALATGRTYRVSYYARWLAGCNVIHTREFEYGLMRTSKLSIPGRLGTPGARNSRWRQYAGPVIGQVRQTPAVPFTSQPVTIEATITDPDGILAATLSYATGRPQNFQTVAMTDGAAGIAGDDRWGATIPGFAVGTKIVFFIEAVDGTDTAARHPREAPARTCLYQVDNPITSQLYVYRLILDDANQAELQNRPLHSNHHLDATLVFGDAEIYHNVGVRYHGSPWQRPANPRMFRVRMNDDEPLHGVTSFNLSRYGSAQNERAAYYTMRLNRAPWAPQFYVHLQYNGSFYGVFEQIHAINQDYLDLWWPNDAQGKLYKISGRHKFDNNGGFVENVWCSYVFRGTNPDDYRWYLLPSNRELEDDHRELIEFCRFMTPGTPPNGTNDASFNAEAEYRIDTDEFLRVHSLRILNDDWDTIGVGNGQNAYIYYAPLSGKWRLIPWDLDHTFGDVDAALYPTREAGMARFLRQPAYNRMYLRFLKELIDGPYSVAHMSKILDPTYQVLGTESGGANPQGIKNYITTRAQRARAILPGAVAFNINEGNMDLETPLETATVIGTAPVEVAKIIHRSGSLPLRWSSTTQWSTTVGLIPGDNAIALSAFDGLGRLVGTDTVTITCTAVWNPPIIDAIVPAEGPETGGFSVSIAGSGFRSDTRVYFGGQSVTAKFDTSSLLIATAPAGTGDVAVRVVNLDGQEAFAPYPLHYEPIRPRFIRGDANGQGSIDIADAIKILSHLFARVPLPCHGAADANDDGALDIADAIKLLDFLFRKGALPGPAACGVDPTEDLLPCDSYPPCP